MSPAPTIAVSYADLHGSFHDCTSPPPAHTSQGLQSVPELRVRPVSQIVIVGMLEGLGHAALITHLVVSGANEAVDQSQDNADCRSHDLQMLASRPKRNSGVTNRDEPAGRIEWLFGLQKDERSHEVLLITQISTPRPPRE